MAAIDSEQISDLWEEAVIGVEFRSILEQGYVPDRIRAVCSGLKCCNRLLNDMDIVENASLV